MADTLSRVAVLRVGEGQMALINLDQVKSMYEVVDENGVPFVEILYIDNTREEYEDAIIYKG